MPFASLVEIHLGEYSVDGRQAELAPQVTGVVLDVVAVYLYWASPSNHGAMLVINIKSGVNASNMDQAVG